MNVMTVLRERFAADERGVGVVIAISVSAIVFVLGATWTSVARHQVESSSYSRSREMALDVAEAGLNEAMAKLSADPALLGVQPTGDVTDDNGEKYGEYDVEIQTAGAANQRVIEVTGYSPGKDARRVATRRVEATVSFGNPDEFNFALFSASDDPNQPGWMKAGSALSVNGDIYANDLARWQWSSSINGDVITWAGIASRGVVNGDLWTAGYYHEGCAAGGRCGVWVRSGQVNGDVYSRDEADGDGGQLHVVRHTPSGESDPRVTGEIWVDDPAPNGLSVTNGTVDDADPTQGVTPPSPPAWQLPTYSWDGANYSSVLSTDVEGWDAYFDAHHATGMSGAFNIQDTNPNDTLEAGGRYCPVAGTCPPVRQLTITSWKMTGNVTIYTNRPVLLSSDITNGTSGEVVLTIISTFDDNPGGSSAVRFEGNVTPSDGVKVLVYAPNDTVSSDNAGQSIDGGIFAEQIELGSNFTIEQETLRSCPTLVAGCDVPGFTWSDAAYMPVKLETFRELPSS